MFFFSTSRRSERREKIAVSVFMRVIGIYYARAVISSLCFIMRKHAVKMNHLF